MLLWCNRNLPSILNIKHRWAAYWARATLINPPPLLASGLAAGGYCTADGGGAFGDPMPAIWSCCVGDVTFPLFLRELCVFTGIKQKNLKHKSKWGWRSFYRNQRILPRIHVAVVDLFLKTFQRSRWLWTLSVLPQNLLIRDTVKIFSDTVSSSDLKYLNYLELRFKS